MLSLITLIKTVGYLGIFAIIFAETGLFFGFFFPGDSLLFTAGFLASQNFLDIKFLIILVVAAAFLGNSAGYWFGRKVGPILFTKEDSLFFHKKHVERAQSFYGKHGPKTMLIARFLPIVRTFVPILAGVGKMRYQVFAYYNLIGAVLWGGLLTGLGFFLGNSIPNIDHYLIPIILLIIFVSFLPTIIHVWRDPGDRQAIKNFIKKNILKNG